MENNNFLGKLESINEQLNLTHYWIILLKYKRLFFILPALFAVLSYLVSLQINPIFKSSATLVIEESGKNIINIQEVYAGGQSTFGGSNNYINNQIQILESDEVLSSILKDEKVYARVNELYKKMPKKFINLDINIFDKIKQKKLYVNKLEV